MRFRETSGVNRLEVPGLRAGFAGFCAGFLALSIVNMALGRPVPAALFLASSIILGGFLFVIVRTGAYSPSTWLLESLFFVVWLVVLRLTGGGFHHGMDAAAVTVVVVAVLVGRGFLKVVVVLLATGVPVVLRIVEAAYPGWFYFPMSNVNAKLGAGGELVGVAAILTVVLDRILAAYFRERQSAEQKAVELAQMIVTDGMTGLANRAGIFRALDAEVERARRYVHPLSVVMIDVDGFKAVNDSQGHLAGDMVIRGIARVVRSVVRHPEVAGRRGGDEFLLVLPEARLVDAEGVAEQIRIDVAALNRDGGSGKITISAGVAQWTGETPTELVEIADRRLYVAKNSGRNRVVCTD